MDRADVALGRAAASRPDDRSKSFKSELAQRIDSIPGFGLICSAELPGEIGDLARFGGEAGVAVLRALGY
jgi:hypothetical protein